MLIDEDKVEWWTVIVMNTEGGYNMNNRKVMIMNIEGKYNMDKRKWQIWLLLVMKGQKNKRT